MIRAVLDTNVLIASTRSRSPHSPNREILERWRLGQFSVLYSIDILHEYAEKLLAHGIPDALILEILRALRAAAEEVTIRFFHLPLYPADHDDIAFILCAANGGATHLVTYDGGFDALRGTADFAICAPLEFLRMVRQME